MRITVLTHNNLYESKRYFGKMFAEALVRAGHEINVVDGDSIESQEKEFKKACNPALTDFTCSFNSQIPTDDGKFICDFTGVPHVFFNIDPLYYYRDTFNSPYMMVSCVDHFDVEYAHARGFKKAFFFGHAVERDLSPEPHQERPYDVVFIGSCYDHETLRKYWRENLAPETVKVIENAIDIVLGDNKTPVFTAVENALREKGMDLQHDNKIVSLAHYVDNYVRGKDRVELIRSIKKAQIHVFGGTAYWRKEPEILDWNHSLASQKNVTIHPAVTFKDSLSILKQSKICLNSMPFFKNGTHERIFSGLACGSLPITTDNLWIRDHFTQGEDILLYRHAPEGWKEVDEIVNDYLADPVKRERIVSRGREKVMRYHTWDVRVQQLMDNWERITK
jgi:spore maturation protein CgeB